MFEHRKQPLASRRTFFSRVVFFCATGISLAVLFIFIGMLGYRYFVDLSWIDAFVNASMTLSGMGERAIVETVTGKIFSSIYALFCGLMFSVIVSILFAPFVHRLYHKFHLDNE